MNKRSLYLLLTAVLVFGAVCMAKAADLDDTDPNTAYSGWAYSALPGHMGTKYLLYAYESSSVENEYKSYVQGGIALWGSHINMNPSSSASAGLVINVSAAASTATAATSVQSYYPSNTQSAIYVKVADGWSSSPRYLDMQSLSTDRFWEVGY